MSKMNFVLEKGWLSGARHLPSPHQNGRPNGEVSLLVVHGSDDSLIRPALGRQLYEAAREPKQFVLVEGGSHHNTNSVGQRQYREAVASLFHLK